MKRRFAQCLPHAGTTLKSSTGVRQDETLAVSLIFKLWFKLTLRLAWYTEGYRSGHNEAVLKPPCHSESNRRKSPVFEGNTRTFRTAKFFLLMFFLIQFHSSVFIRRDIEVVITRRS